MFLCKSYNTIYIISYEGDSLINISDKLKNKLNEIPSLPGIYKMLDSRGNIIYVGKSKALNKRVKTYFADNPKWEKVTRMVHLIDDIEYIITDTHLEARLLECSLIKEIKPIFNSQMKHDRGYAYIKIENFNKYRSLSVVNTREENTYGPFRRRFHLNETVNFLKNLYPIKSSNNSYEFEYHLFPAPMNNEAFNDNKKSLEEILSNKDKFQLFMKTIETKMKYEASIDNFEMASMYKNILDNVSYIFSSIKKYDELIYSKILLNIPVENEYILFYIENCEIIKRKKYKRLNSNIINKFIECQKSKPNKYFSMDEKSMMDFKDIVYSEILSLPKSMVTII